MTPVPEPTLESQPASAGPPSPRWGRGLFVGAAVALAAIEVYYLFRAQVRDPAHLPIGLAILFLAGVPALLWARRGRATLPVFETLMLTTANAYAFPLLNGHRELIFYTPEDITTAGLAVILFQAVAITVYEVTRGKASSHPFWKEEVISQDIGRWIMYGMALNSTFVLVSTFTEWVPGEAMSVLRAIFFGIGIVSAFVGSRRLGEGRLTRGEKLFFFVNLAIQCIGTCATLYLVNAVSLLLLALVGYVSSSGRVPIVLSVSALLLLAVLHNGKAEMRNKYWNQEYMVPGFTDLPAFYQQWFTEGLKSHAEDGESRFTAKLIERTSLFHIMCLVVSTTPSRQPFLDGETYRDIPAQFVPRFFWPNKPQGHVSTTRLAVYYGLQTEEDAQTTTIGFGMLTEAYANFGWLGVAAIGAFLAYLIKRVQCWAAESPLFSYGGLGLIILLAWSFQVEFTLSIWLASLYQACVAVLLIPFALRRIFGG